MRSSNADNIKEETSQFEYKMSWFKPWLRVSLLRLTAPTAHCSPSHATTHSRAARLRDLFQDNVSVTDVTKFDYCFFMNTYLETNCKSLGGKRAVLGTL